MQVNYFSMLKKWSAGIAFLYLMYLTLSILTAIFQLDLG